MCKALGRAIALTVLSLGLHSFGPAAQAGQFFQDFSGNAVGSTTFADGSQLFSTALGTTAKVTDATYHELQLMVSGASFTKSAYLAPDLDPGAPIYAFSAKWNATVGGNFPDTAADGFSFSFGPLRSLDLLQGNVETGYGTGLCFYAQTWTGFAPGFYLAVNGVNVGSIPTNNPGAVWGINSPARHFFEVDWHWLNGLTVRLDGVGLFTNVPTTGFLPHAGDSFAWATRVGAYSETIALDNITILTGGNLNPIPLGTPYYFSGENQPGETAAKAFDGSPATKWFTATTTSYIGAQVQGDSAVARAYTITSANDLPSRDPRIWKLQQTINSGANWTDRASGSGFFANRFERRAWAVSSDVPGSGYRLNISANNGAAETQLAELAVYRLDAVGPTIAVTAAATSVSNTTATLNGTVTPAGISTLAWFEWSNNTNAGFGFSSTPFTVGSGTGAVAASVTVSGLAPGGPTYFRLVASNSLLVVRGATMVLQTEPLQLIGLNPFTNECHTIFNDPGVTAFAVPIALSGGSYHSMALRPDGVVIAWGAGTDASGQPNYGQSAVPGLGTVIAIAAGSYHSLALLANGTVVGWGRNNNGQLGLNGLPGVRAIAGGLEHSIALKNDGTVASAGNTQYGQAPAPAAATNILALDAGEYHNLAIRSNRTVIAWGAGTINDPLGFVHYGQSLVPANATNVIAVAAGAYHSLALRGDGTVVGWGAGTIYNPDDLQSYGQSIIPPSATNVIAIAAGGRHNLALRSNGSVIAWGDDTSGQSDVPLAATNILAIAAGYNWSMAVRADGALLGWGDNGYGHAVFPAAVTNLPQPFAVSGVIDTNSPGSYVLTYSSTNSTGAVGTVARTVVVVDSTPPSLTLSGGNPYFLTVGTPYSEPGYSAMDACEGDVTAKVQVTGSVNVGVVATNTLTYTVSDTSGHVRATNRTVVVVSAPTITGVVGQTVATNSVTGTRTILLSATVNPNGRATGGWFQYGITTAYGSPTNVTVFAGGIAANPLSLLVTNVLAGATYHFRVVATNSVGASFSPDQTVAVTPAFVRGDFDGDGLVSQGELDAVLTNYLVSSPWLKITNTAGLGTTNVSFALTNSLTGSYTVESSTDLIDWVRLGPATPRFEFSDTNAPGSVQRYYRLRWP